MAPCTKPATVLSEEEDKPLTPQAEKRKLVVVKKNIVYFGYGHLGALYGLYLAFTSAKWETLLLAYAFYLMAGIGITAGAHRLWTHRAYKATLPLQIILMVMNTFGYQNTILTWVRDHRTHHKYSDTDADPHNATRGFFFSHIGWLLVKKNEIVKQKGQAIDMSDMYANPVVMFQKRHAVLFIGTVCFLIPTILPMVLFGETLSTAWHVTLLRYFTSLHVTFLINSAGHLWGSRPYDKRIMPTQSPTIAFLTSGEGFHNYHHVFPWDYRAAELGNNWMNLTTKFIDVAAWIGWAYDMKAVNDEVIRGRAERTGDGTNLWGWGDRDMSDEVKRRVVSKGD